jgi:hypothetical protein
MLQIDESMNIHKEWFKEANEMTLEKLPDFLKKLTENYEHDYGTICHAIAAAAIAAAWAVERMPQGGITGFQAGCIMWEFIKHWNFSYNKTGLGLIDYDNFLYPQYADRFDKTISSDIWAAIQKEAKAKLEDADTKYAAYLKSVKEFEKDLAIFVDKYPDYPQRKEYYAPISMGTGKQWDAEEKKKAMGFEFAPQKPCEPIRKDSKVYIHWESIVSGYIPFGYHLGEEN